MPVCLQAQGRLRLLLEPSYAVLEFELASALHCIIHSHWQRMLQNSAFRPSVQVLRLPATPPDAPSQLTSKSHHKRRSRNARQRDRIPNGEEMHL